MDPVQQIQQAHQGVRNVLLNGRILINGLPLTTQELGQICAAEQLLFAKAELAVKAEQIPADKKAQSPGKKKG